MHERSLTDRIDIPTLYCLRDDVAGTGLRSTARSPDPRIFFSPESNLPAPNPPTNLAASNCLTS